jgi:hypothetical protein
LFTQKVKRQKYFYAITNWLLSSSNKTLSIGCKAPSPHKSDKVRTFAYQHGSNELFVLKKKKKKPSTNTPFLKSLMVFKVC